MGKSLTRKIIESHYVKGSMVPGEEVFIKVDQTLTHDINAVMTYLAFEAIGLDRIRTECSVSYLDHNLLYVNNMTPDDHIYLQSAAEKFGVHVSRPGNGICHTVHVSRFGAPGKISMGGDSHTPHGGSIGMLCIGVGGMDVATAMTRRTDETENAKSRKGKPDRRIKTGMQHQRNHSGNAPQSYHQGRSWKCL